MKSHKRVQFDFSEDAIKRLDQLVDETDSTSRAEVVRNALRLYEFTVKQLRGGYELQFKKNKETISVLPLSAV